MPCDVIEVIVSQTPDPSQIIVSGVAAPVSIIETDENFHNSFPDLQGGNGLHGTSGQYYHLDQTEYNKVHSLASGNYDAVLHSLSISGSTQAQSNYYVLYGTTTTSAVERELFLNSQSGRITLANNTAVLFEGQISAYELSTSHAASWSYNCMLQNKSGVALKIAPSQVFELVNSNPGTLSASVNPDGSGINYLNIRVRGENSTSIKWTASVRATVVS